MNRRIVCLGCFCMVMLGCNESPSYNYNDTDDGVPCNTSYEPQCRPDNQSYTMCHEGKVKVVSCDINTQICYNGGCVKKDQTDLPQTDCNIDTYIKHCENNQLFTCIAGKVQKQTCKAGCDGSDCKIVPDDTQPQSDCDETFLPYCENAQTLVECQGGSYVRTTCNHGCDNNTCKDTTTPVETGCGNLRIDDNEVCDGTNLNGLTCKDVPGLSKKKGYSGSPVCNAACTGIERGTCVESLCGNGRVDKEDGEICDFDNKYEYWNGDYTCDDYMNRPGLQWEEGGLPGCSSNCKGLSKGTCKLVAQPIDNIQSCAFISLTQDTVNKIATAQGKIEVTENVLEEDVAGRMACILHDNSANHKAYEWGLKAEASKITCNDCGANEYLLSADYDYSSLPGGIYDCVFLVNTHKTYHTYYMCSTTLGYPIPMEDVPDSTMTRQIQVESSAIEGEVLAHWNFDSYAKNSEVTSVKADDGIFANDSIIAMSDGTKLRMLSGSSGFPNSGASSNNLSELPTYTENSKHFVISLKSTGYRNIRFQFKYAGSSVYSHLVAAYAFGGLVQVVGTDQEILESNKYQDYPLTVLPNADNQSAFELRIYPYAIEEDNSNSTVRLDDIYILGDKM